LTVFILRVARQAASSSIQRGEAARGLQSWPDDFKQEQAVAIEVANAWPELPAFRNQGDDGEVANCLTLP
jgi:hypothetical protein